jgi:hypothetical protein
MCIPFCDQLSSTLASRIKCRTLLNGALWLSLGFMKRIISKYNQSDLEWKDINCQPCQWGETMFLNRSHQRAYCLFPE